MTQDLKYQTVFITIDFNVGKKKRPYYVILTRIEHSRMNKSVIHTSHSFTRNDLVNSSVMSAFHVQFPTVFPRIADAERL